MIQKVLEGFWCTEDHLRWLLRHIKNKTLEQ